MHAVHRTMGKEKRNICQWCGETIMRRSNLWNHEKRVHTCTPKGAHYQCDRCGKSFTTKGKLVGRLVTHNGIKKYICKVCGRAFGQQASLLRHKPIHTGEKKHSCSYCDFKCIQLYSLKRHILTHTGQSLMNVICAENSLDKYLPLQSINANIIQLARTRLWIDDKVEQSELPRPIPQYSVESDLGCTSRIYFDNAGDNMTLM